MTRPAPKRVLIADDHFAIRVGTRHILENELPGMEFGEATTAAEVLCQMRNADWNVLILDINLPDGNGLDIIKQLKEEKISTPVLVFSMHREDAIAVRALRAGASGYLSKDAANTELGKAVLQLFAGRKYITLSVAELMASHLEIARDKMPHEYLSDREYQTMLLIASGRTISEIATALSLGVPTVSTYRARILAKTGLKNNAELTHYAMENKLL